jgi:hypothetical protein
MQMKNKMLYKGLAIMWLIFGIILLMLPLVSNGDTRSITLGLIAALLFFISSYLNWKKYRGNSNEK